ncbi:MAG: amidohydrolase family protein [Acidimicrobiales bacterium]
MAPPSPSPSPPQAPPGSLLPDPEPRPVSYTVISVDDHLVEPADMFEGRLPPSMADRAPRVVTTSHGHEVWEFDDNLYRQVGLNAVAGRPKQDWTLEPVRFDQIRPGCYDIEARLADMDINGVWASVNFPSQITGFCGSVFSKCSDPALGLAVTRAWNDWLAEEWWAPHPDRIVPMGITFLADVKQGAAEIRRNAQRGFTAVTLPEAPHNLGLPSLHSGYWDPILAACQETETVVCLHVGSSGMAPMASDAPLVELGATLFSALSLTACADWLWSGVPVRYPGLKVAMSEGGIGWVPMLLDRLDYIIDQSGHGRGAWMSAELKPAEVVRRNFWFCTIDDPSMLACRHRIGVDHIMVETDYPHADSTWPDTQAFLTRRLEGIPDHEIRMITHENAARLFRHPLPDKCLP